MIIVKKNVIDQVAYRANSNFDAAVTGNGGKDLISLIQVIPKLFQRIIVVISTTTVVIFIVSRAARPQTARRSASAIVSSFTIV